MNNILKELNKMKNNKNYHFRNCRYIGNFSSMEDAIDYAIKLFYNVDLNDINRDTLSQLVQDIDKYYDINDIRVKLANKFDLIELDFSDYFVIGNSNINGNGNIYVVTTNELEKSRCHPWLSRYFDALNTEIVNINDEVGDTTTISRAVDLNTRDLPFVYINGKLIIPNHDCTHSELLNEVYNIHIVRDRIDRQDDLIENINKQFELKSFCAGQIVKDIAIIDSVTCSGCTPEEVTKELIKYSNINKVYVTEDRKSLTRLAKMIYKI